MFSPSGDFEAWFLNLNIFDCHHLNFLNIQRAALKPDTLHTCGLAELYIKAYSTFCFTHNRTIFTKTNNFLETRGVALCW